MKPVHLVVATVVALAYAGCFTAIRIGLVWAPPLRFAGERALAAGVALLVASAATGRGIVPPRRLRRWIPALAGVLALQYAAMFLSPGRAGAGISSVLANTGPIFLVVLAALVLHERITRRVLVSLVLGALGVTFIVWPAAADGGSVAAAAMALPLAVAVGAAAETLLLKKVNVGDALLSVAAWQLILGSLPLLAASSLTESRAIEWTPEFQAAFGFVAIPGTALALALWYWLVQREPVHRLAAFMFIVPVAGLVLGWIYFAETISPAQIAGLVLAVGGIFLAGGRTDAADGSGPGRLRGGVAAWLTGRRRCESGA